ncbi:MAG TPA: c(7)-type cytochrome triheme domain-containing protein [Candidatus Deferrimicrobiaceae bacterium]|nr:c(7)-type cytochrome triheme domain-containing protein [Candidatus Deferrimicrobiaceae bacterium]
MSYRPWMCALGLAVALAVVAASSGSALAQVKPPADFKFESGKDSPGPVTFSHGEHKEKVGGCTACHVKIFKMKKGQDAPFTMERMEKGQLCGACHNGKTEVKGKVVFASTDKANCEKCHKK